MIRLTQSHTNGLKEKETCSFLGTNTIDFSLLHEISAVNKKLQTTQKYVNRKLYSRDGDQKIRLRDDMVVRIIILLF